MARKKKEKKTMVIGSIVVNIDTDVDLGSGDTYAVYRSDDKPFFPRYNVTTAH